jgi:putative component of toxin-antitoxin plasmid stabilization module
MGYTHHMRVEQTEVYRDWINSLRDIVARARIQVRVDRLVHGNPGKHRVLREECPSSRSISVRDTASITRDGEID